MGSLVRLLHIKDGPADVKASPHVAVGSGVIDFHAIAAASTHVDLGHRGARRVRDGHVRGGRSQPALAGRPGTRPGAGMSGRVGVIGCGNISKAYAEKIGALPDLELVACADLDRRGRSEFAAPARRPPGAHARGARGASRMWTWCST